MGAIPATRIPVKTPPANPIINLKNKSLKIFPVIRFKQIIAAIFIIPKKIPILKKTER